MKTKTTYYATMMMETATRCRAGRSMLPAWLLLSALVAALCGCDALDGRETAMTPDVGQDSGFTGVTPDAGQDSGPFGVTPDAALDSGSTGVNPDTSQDSERTSVTPDNSLQSAATLPPHEDGLPRPVATMTDATGIESSFALDELLVATDDAAELDALLLRLGGEVIVELHPPGLDLPNLPAAVLVRVHPAPAEAADVAETLRVLEPDAGGALRVSNQAGIDLLGAWATEAQRGMTVSLNWVSGAEKLANGTSTEAPTDPADQNYSSNAFDWWYLESTGVTEAWRILDKTDRFDGKVSLAVIDRGFESQNADYPAGLTAYSTAPGQPALDIPLPPGSCGGGNCPWHGTGVAQTAMAVPDNGWGTAGPAGPVATPMLLTGGTSAKDVMALSWAFMGGAKIVNMSFSVYVPGPVTKSLVVFAQNTQMFASGGMLLFASAGNDGIDVNAKGCWGSSCVQVATTAPCELPGVHCIGALDFSLGGAASYSNWGASSVEMFAPGTVYVGSTPEHPDNHVEYASGTSMASPFVAGVAALVWAADPTQTADEVWAKLVLHAQASPDPLVPRTVYAFGAVVDALGNEPPGLTIVSPLDYAVLLQHQTLNLHAVTSDPDGDLVDVAWQADGVLHIGAGADVTVPAAFLGLGSHTIKATATDSFGYVVHKSVTVTVQQGSNHPPVVTVESLVPVSHIAPDESLFLLGTAVDPDGDAPLTYIWYVVVNGSGDYEEIQVGSPFLSGWRAKDQYASVHDGDTVTVTLQATDPYGAAGLASIDFIIDVPSAAPTNHAPYANLLSPAQGATLDADAPVTVLGSATDPDGDSPIQLRWQANVAGTSQWVDLGTAPSFEWTPSKTLALPAGAFSATVGLYLTVTDPAGASKSTYVNLLVERAAPAQNVAPSPVDITSPSSGDVFSAGSTITLSGTASDPDGDSPLTYTWSAQVLGAQFGALIGSGEVLHWTPSDTFTLPDGAFDLPILVTLSVKDPYGNTASDVIKIVVVD